MNASSLSGPSSTSSSGGGAGARLRSGPCGRTTVAPVSSPEAATRSTAALVTGSRSEPVLTASSSAGRGTQAMSPGGASPAEPRTRRTSHTSKERSPASPATAPIRCSAPTRLWKSVCRACRQAASPAPGPVGRRISSPAPVTAISPALITASTTDFPGPTRSASVSSASRARIASARSKRESRAGRRAWRSASSRAIASRPGPPLPAHCTFTSWNERASSPWRTVTSS